MKVHVLYKQVWDKAEEVQDALHAVMCAWLGKADRNGIGGIVEYFTHKREYACEYDLRKDTRRHVKLLYADYCTLRDELIALLTSDVGVVK